MCCCVMRAEPRLSKCYSQVRHDMYTQSTTYILCIQKIELFKFYQVMKCKTMEKKYPPQQIIILLWQISADIHNPPFFQVFTSVMCQCGEEKRKESRKKRAENVWIHVWTIYEHQFYPHLYTLSPCKQLAPKGSPTLQILRKFASLFNSDCWVVAWSVTVIRNHFLSNSIRQRDSALSLQLNLKSNCNHKSQIS